MAMAERRIPGLATLARAHGIQLDYVDTEGQRQHASQEALLAVLAAMGAPVERPRDVSGALEALRARERAELAPPVAVAWTGDRASLAIHEEDGAMVDCT